MGKKRKLLLKDCDCCGKWNSAHECYGKDHPNYCDNCLESRRYENEYTK